MEIFDFGILENQRDLEDENLFIGEQDLVLFELEQQTSLQINGIAENTSLTPESSLVRVQLKVVEDSNGNNVIDDNDQIIEEQIQFPDRRVLESEEPVSLQDINLSPGDYLLELNAIPGNESTTFGEVKYSIELIPTLKEPPPNNDNVEALEFNQIIPGNVESGEQDIYTFNGSEGQKLYYDGLTGGLVSVQLLSPSGINLFETVINADRNSKLITLDQEGEYKLSFETNTSTLPSDFLREYSFQFLDVDSNAQEISFNTVIEEDIEGKPLKIDPARESDLYSFNSLAEQQIFVDLKNSPIDDENFIIFDSENQEIERKFTNSTGFGVELAADEKYILVVEGSSNTETPNYSFELISPFENAPPVGEDDTASTDEDTDIIFTFDSLLENDSDPDGDNLRIDNIGDEAIGSVFFDESASNIVYQPNTLQLQSLTDGETATDTFEYTISDGKGGTDTATVTITVTGINDSPTAEDDFYDDIPENTPLIKNVLEGILSNDTDLEGDPLAVTLIEDVNNGDLELESDGSFTYTPNEGFTGTDQFTYQVSDDKNATDTATVELIVNEINSNPIAVDDFYDTPENTPLIINPSEGILSNDSDPEGDLLTITFNENVENGNLELNRQNGSFTYTPNDGFTGIEQFTYEISDGNGGTDTATVTLTIEDITDITGTSGRDILPGTDEDDLFRGSQGPDIITTGQGIDTIVYESIVDAGDIIRDLEIGSDIIDLRGMLKSVGFNGLDPIDDGYISFMSSGSGTILMLDADGDGSALARPYLFVDNVTETELSNSNNFIFV